MSNSEDEKGNTANKQNSSEFVGSYGYMLERTNIPPENIPLAEIISQLPKAQRERLTAGYDLKKLARIFEDADTMPTVDGFLKHGMNVSETSRELYMHRNNLIYRLNKIQRVTGLDVRAFDSAVTFDILRILYELK